MTALDPQAKAMMDTLAAMGVPPLSSLPPDQGRMMMAGMADAMDQAKAAQAEAANALRVALSP